MVVLCPLVRLVQNLIEPVPASGVHGQPRTVRGYLQPTLIIVGDGTNGASLAAPCKIQTTPKYIAIVTRHRRVH